MCEYLCVKFEVSSKVWTNLPPPTPAHITKQTPKNPTYIMVKNDTLFTKNNISPEIHLASAS